jgi:anti-sigma regulatory factor (Ser/Thr protein kinase)
MNRQLDVRLPFSTRAARIARRALAPLTAGLDPELGRTLALLATELVTNSIQHSRPTRSRVQLRAWLYPPAARIAVGDSGRPFEARVAEPDLTNEQGRGLLLIDTLADCWGVSHDDLTWSWFEVHGPSGPLDPFFDSVIGWPLAAKTLAWSMLVALGSPDEISLHRLGWNLAHGDVVALLSDEPVPLSGSRAAGGPIEDPLEGHWWLETVHSMQTRTRTAMGVRRRAAGSGRLLPQA